jgi:4-amino-4-deoxy-L-arabinose transferase-like glycosyltransferase
MSSPHRTPGLPRVGASPVTRAILALIAALLLLRLLTLGAYVVYDTSEARYGEAARQMLVTGDWIVPWYEPGVPFWGKPPLYAWAGAASMAVLGVGEFPLRLPSWLFALVSLALTAAWARARAADALAPGPGAASASGTGAVRLQALLAVLVLASTLLFFVVAGAVLTEPGLLVATLGMSAAFWFAAVRAQRAGDEHLRGRWAWGFFAAAGLGMLAKGPVAIVFAGLPIVAWWLWQALAERTAGGLSGVLRQAWRSLPWIRGVLLALAVCGPWYLAMEWRTPGFWEYYFIGEHVLRFITPGWQGNRFGTSHDEPLGAIWLGAAAAALPWTPVLLGLAAVALRRRLQRGRSPFAVATADAGADAATRRYLWCVALAPLVFFTVSRNVIWIYALSSLPAVAMLLAPALQRQLLQEPEPAHAPGGRGRWRRSWPLLLAGLAAGAYAAVFLAWMPGRASERSTAAVVAAWTAQQQQVPGRLVVVRPEMPHSARWYSRGQALGVPDVPSALAVGDAVLYVALQRPEGAPAGPAPQGLAPVADLGLHGRWQLWRLDRRPPPAPATASP